MEQMTVLLNYIYQGSTRITQNDLPSFLQLAEDLRIDGLIRSFEKGKVDKDSSGPPQFKEEYLGIYETETSYKSKEDRSPNVKRNVISSN